MASALPPLRDLMVAPLTHDDFDFDLDPESEATLSEFEAAWKTFLLDNPDVIPMGKREKKIEDLQKQLKSVRKGQHQVKTELEQQLDFFRKSQDKIEESCKKQMEEIEQKTKELQVKQQARLDSVAIAEHLLSQSIPWEYFLERVDNAVIERASRPRTPMDKDDEVRTFWESWNSNGQGSVSIGKKAKPSPRAMALVDDRNGCSEDIQRRAHMVDHALLCMQVKMIQKEAEGYENVSQSQEELGAFLTEQNIWVMLTKQSSSKPTVAANSS